jgi:hypothetical protein
MFTMSVARLRLTPKMVPWFFTLSVQSLYYTFD